MPRRKDIALPTELEKAYPEGLRPKRIAQNQLLHTSPFAEYPGEIITTMSLSAIDYDEWWKAVGDGQDEEDKRHWSFFEWETRFHLVKKWSFKDDLLTTDVIKKDPIDIPDTRIINWIIAITQPILTFSVSLPNSQGPLNDTTTN